MESKKFAQHIQLPKDDYEKLINSKDSYSPDEASWKLKSSINEILLKHVIIADPNCKGLIETDMITNHTFIYLFKSI